VIAGGRGRRTRDRRFARDGRRGDVAQLAARQDTQRVCRHRVWAWAGPQFARAAIDVVGGAGVARRSAELTAPRDRARRPRTTVTAGNSAAREIAEAPLGRCGRPRRHHRGRTSLDRERQERCPCLASSPCATTSKHCGPFEDPRMAERADDLLESESRVLVRSERPVLRWPGTAAESILCRERIAAIAISRHFDGSNWQA